MSTDIQNDNIDLEYINNKIIDDSCDNILNKLKDINLIDEYKNCNSVKNKIKKLELLLEKHNIENKTNKLIIDEYILDLIPAGTKGAIRGSNC